jgi:alkyldihydroxyacetonephosphate synthase
MKHMKWSGWGGENGTSFRHDDKPAFAAFVKAVIDIDVTKEPAPVLSLASLPIASVASPELRASPQAAVSTDYIEDDPLDRVVHV